MKTLLASLLVLLLCHLLASCQTPAPVPPDPAIEAAKLELIQAVLEEIETDLRTEVTPADVTVPPPTRSASSGPDTSIPDPPSF